MRLFLAFSGNNIENFLKQAKQNDNAEEVRRLAYSFEKGNKILESWALSTGGSIIESSLPSVLLEIDAYCLKDLETIKKQYESTASTTLSVGVGKKLSEASSALLIAQTKGPGKTSFFTKEDDLKKTLAPTATAGAKGVGTTNANAIDTISLNTVSTPAPPQTQEDVQSAIHNEAIPMPGQPIPAPEVQTPATPVSQPVNFEQRFRAHADKTEQSENAQKLKSSEYYQGIKQKVAEALTSIKEQLPFIATLRNSSPDAYEAVVALVQSVILLGREIGQTDQKIEKSIMTSVPNPSIYSDATITNGVNDMQMSEETVFDQEQVAIGAQIEMEEHGLTLERAMKIAQDHLKEDPDYYKKELGKSEGFQYDGPVEGADSKHYFLDGNTKWLFTESSKQDALAAVAGYRLAYVLKPVCSSYPVQFYQLAGRPGTIEPVSGRTDLSYTLPHQLTVNEKKDLVAEMFIDWLLGNPGTDESRLFRTPEGGILGRARTDSFKDFNDLGTFYDNVLESFNNGTLVLDLSDLPKLMQEVNSIPDDEYLENVGEYAQAMWPTNTQQQAQFASKVLERKRNCSDFSNVLKQSLNKGERREYGLMRGHIDSPVGAVIEGKMKVKHWDGSESWKSIKSGAILGLDPGVAGEGHAVSSKNPGAK